jgi:hypothetical protein
MLNDFLPDDIGVSVSYPLPGTLFYERVKGELQKKANWTDSNEMVLMFKNTYSPAFYKELHQYIHKNFRKHQGYDSVRSIFCNADGLSFETLRRMTMLGYYIPATFIQKRKLEAEWK